MGKRVIDAGAVETVGVAAARNDYGARAARFPHRAREQVLHMLAEAAELEHAALCVYLYAAFSLKRGTDEGLTAEELEAVTAWRKTLFQIARDEMAHLVTVNNIIVAVGGSAHFNRANFPVAPNYFPGGFTLRLAPFTRETLDNFIALERSDAPGARSGESARPAIPAAYLFPAAVPYETIGAFYGALKETLTAAAATLGEPALFVGLSGQLTPAQAKLPNSRDITGLAAALAAIDTIIAEGEGADGGSADCHHARFAAVKASYETLSAKRGDFVPSRAAATNPVMRRPAPGTENERCYIGNDRARECLDAANAVYGQILRCLTQAHRPREALSRAFMDVAVVLMHVLSDLCGYLTTLPAGADDAGDKGPRAGMTFTMLRSVEPLAQGDAERMILRERLKEIAERLEQLARVKVFADGAAKVREAAAALGGAAAGS
jgi:hypothetical protein